MIPLDDLRALTPTPLHIVTHHPWTHRRVTLICGPPGAGKTTLAHQLHPTTLDLAELPPGTPRQRMRAYGARAHQIGRTPTADIAVIQGAATHTRRHQLAHQTRPWATIVMLTPPELCHQRVTQRNRPGIDGRDLDGQHAAIDTWWHTWNTDNPHT